MALGIYLHIPFCLQKCLYCDFASSANAEELHAPYAAALCNQINAQGSRAEADTVYMGGGTPTVLTVRQLEEITAALSASFRLAADTEFTIEANPGTVDREKLTRLRQSGVNRVSFGVQSFSDRLLKRIGRAHTAAQARTAIAEAREAGFDHISLDLMYGLPGQTLEDVKDSVRQADALAVRHISVYGLKIEPGTPFAAMRENRKLELPSEEAEEMMYDYIMETLPRIGFHRYEISNFAKPGYESRHNMKYWRDAPYIGLGAAAHSYIGARRMSNVCDARTYISRAAEGKSPIDEIEELDEPTLMEEFCFLALRTREGISIEAFNEKFNCNFFTVYGHSISELKSRALIAEDDGRIFLTDLGMKFGNRVFEKFLLK